MDIFWGWNKEKQKKKIYTFTENEVSTLVEKAEQK